MSSSAGYSGRFAPNHCQPFPSPVHALTITHFFQFFVPSWLATSWLKGVRFGGGWRSWGLAFSLLKDAKLEKALVEEGFLDWFSSNNNQKNRLWTRRYIRSHLRDCLVHNSTSILSILHISNVPGYSWLRVFNAHQLHQNLHIISDYILWLLINIYAYINICAYKMMPSKMICMFLGQLWAINNLTFIERGPSQIFQDCQMTG